MLCDSHVEFPIFMHHAFYGVRTLFRNAEKGFENPNGSELFQQLKLQHLYPKVHGNFILDGVLTVEYGQDQSQVDKLLTYLRSKKKQDLSPPPSTRFVIYDLFEPGCPLDPYGTRLEKLHVILANNGSGISTPMSTKIEDSFMLRSIYETSSVNNKAGVVIREPFSVYTPGKESMGAVHTHLSFAKVDVVNIEFLCAGELAELIVTCKFEGKEFKAPFRTKPKNAIFHQERQLAKHAEVVYETGQSVIENSIVLSLS